MWQEISKRSFQCVTRVCIMRKIKVMVIISESNVEFQFERRKKRHVNPVCKVTYESK